MQDRRTLKPRTLTSIYRARETPVGNLSGGHTVRVFAYIHVDLSVPAASAPMHRPNLLCAVKSTDN